MVLSFTMAVVHLGPCMVATICFAVRLTFNHFPDVGPYCGSSNVKDFDYTSTSNEAVVVFYSDTAMGRRRGGKLRALASKGKVDYLPRSITLSFIPLLPQTTPCSSEWMLSLQHAPWKWKQNHWISVRGYVFSWLPRNCTTGSLDLDYTRPWLRLFYSLSLLYQRTRISTELSAVLPK
jgi:hypothetical protein